jgi:hypothetical protein
MDGEQPADVLEELLAVKGKHLLPTAVLLAGSQDHGEDLPQTGLARASASPGHSGMTPAPCTAKTSCFGSVTRDQQMLRGIAKFAIT